MRGGKIPMADANASPSPKKGKTRVTSIEIATTATPDQVWKALTDPVELSRWFPLTAKVKPGVGGEIFLSWGPDCEGKAPITVWEPGRKFAWKEGAEGDPRGVTVEWTIEAREGKTCVRMVQSGFDAQSAEDEEYY